MPAQKLKEHLDAHGIRYVTIKHSPAYTAQELAATTHIPGKEVAKTVIVTVGHDMAMAVVPASHVVDFELLREAARDRVVGLATEDEFKNRFPDCEVGAMPPFGRLYGMETFADAALAEDRWISFNAGTHGELIQMPFADYARLNEPWIMTISRKRN